MAGYEELESRIAALEERVKALEEVKGGASSREDCERAKRVKKVVEKYAAYIEAEGDADFVGRRTIEVADDVFGYAKFVLREPIDLGEDGELRMGVQRTITNAIKKRYGIRAKHGKFIAPDDVE